MTGRTVTLILVDAAGASLGTLPPFAAHGPWWQEAEPLVAAARERFGIEVAILRLLRGRGTHGPTAGGEVVYLAEASGPPPRELVRTDAALANVDAALAPDARRAPWAEPGGPAASVSWGRAALARAGLEADTAVQVRSWNLSAIWRFEAGGEVVAWLKQVPAFFAHETAVLRRVADTAPGLVPRVIEADGSGRMLLAHVPGVDGYGADAAACASIVRAIHPVQTHFADRLDGLLDAGVPDRRLGSEASVTGLAAVAEPWRDRIDGLGALIDGLPARVAGAAGCGVPDTLVHGDLHRGNARFGDGEPVILDWTDASAGHPAFDVLLLVDSLDRAEADAILDAWAERWRCAAPGSDPMRALELLRPVELLRRAQTYAGFVAAIEPSERVYHEADVPACLEAAVAAAPGGWVRA